MTTITIPRAVVEQALEALEQDNPAGRTATITALRAALAEPTGKDSLQVEPTVAENATTQQQIEDTPPSDYQRGYWDGFRIGKREGRIEAEDELAQQQAEPPGCDHCRHPLYAATKCRVCGRVTEQAEPVEPVACSNTFGCRCSKHFASQQAEPVEPVAWMLTDAYNPKVRFLEWTQQPKGYRGDWIKTPLYTAPPQRKPLTQEQLYSLYDEHATHQEEGPAMSGWFDFARAVERAHGITDPATPACLDCQGIGYDASGQLCACQENPSFG